MNFFAWIILFDSPPVPYLRQDEQLKVDQDEDTDQDGDADDCVSKITPVMLQECTTVQDGAEISSSISSLKSAGIIDDRLCAHLTSIHKESMRKGPGA